MFVLEINALRRLKMLFQRPCSSKSSEGACPRTPLAARAFGARDGAPPPNKSNLATALYPHFFISAPFSAVRVLGTSRYHDSDDNENGKKQGIG